MLPLAAPQNAPLPGGFNFSYRLRTANLTHARTRRYRFLRSSLPSEALEEFLSILTPSFMRKPRAFPAFDPRHQRSSSLTTTTYGYNRASQPSTSPVASRASPPALQLLQEQLASRGDGARTPPRLDTSHWPFGGGRSQNPILGEYPFSLTMLRTSCLRKPLDIGNILFCVKKHIPCSLLAASPFP